MNNACIFMWRVIGYGLTVSPAFLHWPDAMQALPAMQTGLDSASHEIWAMDACKAMGD